MNNFNSIQWNKLKNKGYTLEIKFFNYKNTLPFKSLLQLNKFIEEGYEIQYIIRNESIRCVLCNHFLYSMGEIERYACDNCSKELEKESIYDSNYEYNLYNGVY